jgi:sterol desaturase/sphingolipid hydroxylase (fatty acid hydroxylase superfamily)
MRNFRFTVAALGFPKSMLMPSVAALGMLWLWMRTPVIFSLMLVLPVAGLPIVLRTAMGPAAAFSFGLLVGHLLQEIVHHRLHMASCPASRWLSARWREHDFHHHRNEHVDFGTLSGFWDRVLQTSAVR